MEFLLIVVLIGYITFKYTLKFGSPDAKKAAEKMRQSMSDAGQRVRAKSVKKAVSIGQNAVAKREQMAQRETWRAAKEQQDDAEQLHAIHIDSCESKLESLRVLYEAGILDKEEYADRVIRTKAKHEHSVE